MMSLLRSSSPPSHARRTLGARHRRATGLFAALVFSLLAVLVLPAQAQMTTQRLDSTSPETDGNFGFSVATDGIDIIVGARREDTANGTNAGRAYIYVPGPTGWTLSLQSGAPGTERDAFFGQATAITNGLAFGGAPFDDAFVGSTDGGSIFEYESDGTGYAYARAYRETRGFGGGWFGGSLATDGRYLAVGAQRGNRTDEEGAVTVFSIGTGTPTLTRVGDVIHPSDRDNNQRFGLSVSVWGEQGGEVVLGGAPLRDYDGGADRGTVFGFRRDASGWQEFLRLAPNTPAGSRFGFAVAQAGDRLNRAGRTIFVSAVFQDVSDGQGGVFSDAGTVYVYEIAANGTSLNLVQTIAPPAPTNDGRFGFALAHDPSTGTLYVGASGEDVGGSAGAGAVYAYQADAGGTWQQAFRLTSPDVQAGAAFGQALGVNGDVLTVGAPLQDVSDGSGGTIADAGAAYVFTMASTLPVEMASFDARLDGTTARLAWTTASETQNAGFFVEHRAPEATAFAEAGFVEGAGTTTEAQTYAFDVAGLAPGTHAFRLRQVDLDGTTTRSEALEVTVAAGEGLSAVWPNPVRQAASARLAVTRPGHATVAVYDVLGRRVATLHDGPARPGAPLDLRLDASALASGVYLLRATTPSGLTTRRFTVVR
jgi:hypothetical protein